MKNGLNGLRYVCSSCAHEMPTARTPPQGAWAVRRDPSYWHLCERCGCFAVPCTLIEPGKALGRQDYWMFSSCPNAYQCSLHDQYAADCERGRVMQKCFVALHEELGIANHYLMALAKQGLPAAPAA